jgi:hypothetical protein
MIWLFRGPLIRLAVLAAVGVILITYVDLGSIESMISGFIGDIESMIFDQLLGGLI